MKARASTRWFLLALAAEAALAAADVLGGEEIIFTGALVLPVLALAVVGRARDVLRLAVLAVALALLSGLWDDYFASGDHIVRSAVVAVGSFFAVLGARLREASERDRERMAVLAEVTRIGDAPTLEGALERLRDATVPAVADRVWVELAEGSATRRVLDHGRAGAGERVVIPLRIRDRTIGELGFEVRSYGAQDREFLAALAGRVALALANVRLLRELDQTRERLDRTLGALAEAVTVHDAQGGTVYANEAAAELLGARVEPGQPAPAGSLAAGFIMTHEDGTPVRVEEFPGRRLLAGEPDPPPLLTRSVRRDTGR
ncbi:MAG TPA: hypothetical protein VGR12_03415, partial [Solirubrobacteraceae bacterium]|nr:hypothetical protein [Solirubrobacteraceae bacterium]